MNYEDHMNFRESVFDDQEEREIQRINKAEDTQYLVDNFENKLNSAGIKFTKDKDNILCMDYQLKDIPMTLKHDREFNTITMMFLNSNKEYHFKDTDKCIDDVKKIIANKDTVLSKYQDKKETVAVVDRKQEIFNNIKNMFANSKPKGESVNPYKPMENFTSSIGGKRRM